MIGDIITPDILAKKGGDLGSLKMPMDGDFHAISDAKRGSYNRGAFQKADSSKLLADYPPLLSESSMTDKRKSKVGSEAHSDDEIEMRRGLESEH